MSERVQSEVDAVVVGAGFGGLRTLYELRERGLSCRGIEAGGDVGGTWYWNRYPGARTDSDSWAYILAFSEDLNMEWDWKERYPTQPEVLQYLQHVADRFDLRRQISFDTRVASAIWDDDACLWTVTTDGGEVITCTYFIAASGLLNLAYTPAFPGEDTFAGEILQSSRWPHEPVDLDGKRIGVIGTGPTGVQVASALAPVASHLTVFQRTPNYVLPLRNRSLDDATRNEIKRNYPAIWQQAREQAFGLPMNTAGRVGSDVTDDEVEVILERGWETGGFRYIFETFDDLFVNAEINERAADYVRRKIHAMVEDPATAELLCPVGYPLAAKRVPLGAEHYFPIFNRHDVSLVSVAGNPIERVSERGLVLADGTEHELDVIIFATGFDAATGSMTNMDIRGRDGRTIQDHWSDGPATYLGIAVDEFPNLFMVSGPQSPFANLPVVIDNTVAWIGEAIAKAQDRDRPVIEATPEAVAEWGQHLQDVLDMTLLGQGEAAGSWFLGANVPGKLRVVLLYFGGVGVYIARCDDVLANDLEGFTTAAARTPA